MSEQKNRRIENTPYFRHLATGFRVISEDKRQVELSFSSEYPYVRWFGSEILSHDDGAVNLERLNEVGALLFHHGRDPNLGHIPCGRIVSTELDTKNHRCNAVVEFDSDEKSDLIFQKVKSGAIRGTSVGYRIEIVEEVKAGYVSTNGRFKGPCTVAVRWSPYEISIEPTPADDSVGIGRSEEPDEITRKGEMTMPPEVTMQPEERAQQTPTPPAPPATVPSPPAAPERVVDETQVRSQATAEAFSTAAEIYAMCRDFGEDPTPFIKEGKSVDQVRAVILDKVKEGHRSQKPVPAPRLEVVADEEDKYRSAARDGLLMRMGFPVENPVDGASGFRGMSLRSLATSCLIRSEGAGTDVMQMGENDLLRAALGYDERTGNLTPNSAFVSIVNNTVGAVLSGGYATANTTFDQWVGKGSNPNFKVSKRFRLSAAGELVEVKQNGEFKSDSVSDEGVDTQLKTYGKKFGFTRQAFIDDDLGTLAKAIQAQVRSAKRSINKQVYKMLCSNPQYIDKKALFSADHANLGTSGALSSVTLGELYTLMKKQKDLSGKEQLNLAPRFGIFPAALEMEVRKLLNSMSDPSSNNSGVVNPVQGLVTPIFDAEIDQYSDKAFYVAASAMDVDTIEVAYLNGQEQPTLENRVAWDTLGIEYRMYHDWAVSLLDFRGLAKNNGQ